MSIWRWADHFSTTPAAHRVTLGEGNTPLVKSRHIGPAAGLKNLYFKLEIANPTGSYKDRFAAAAISDMLTSGKTRCVATSSGNTGSALAAYCAAAKIACDIAIVETAPPGKLSQMMAYGANIYRIRGFGLDAAVTQKSFEYVRRQGSKPGAVMQISAFALSPAGMSGVQTLSYELAEQLPDIGGAAHVFAPAGGGGLTLAIARGFEGLVKRGKLSRSPRVECVQPSGNDTIATPLRSGASAARAVTCTSKISGLQVPTVIDGNEVIAACRASGGTGHLVEDEDVWNTQARLAREEGIFSEPAGTVALTGALKAAARGELSADAPVVCLVTGFGFKDQPSIDRMLAHSHCPTLELAELPE